MSPSALAERVYVSQYAAQTLGVQIYRAGVLADPDANTVTVTMRDADAAVIFTRAATRDDMGTYSITLLSAESAVPGFFDLTWAFSLDGVPQSIVTSIEVGNASPAYDALSDEFRDVVESVWIRFADGFDSERGGPNLQTYFQSHFGRGRMAQLMQVAMDRINTTSQPVTAFGLNAPAKPFPIAKYPGLLNQALYVETLKHLIRSYVEQPEAMNVSTARVDRRDYMNRWQAVLQMEQDDLKSQIEVFKISMMGLGRAHVLVSGGVYGNYGPTRVAGSSAARPRYWSRFFA